MNTMGRLRIKVSEIKILDNALEIKKVIKFKVGKERKLWNRYYT